MRMDLTGRGMDEWTYELIEDRLEKLIEQIDKFYNYLYDLYESKLIPEDKWNEIEDMFNEIYDAYKEANDTVYHSTNFYD